MSKKRKPSLEAKLLELAQASDARDRQKRSRLDVLATIIWNRAISGDKDSMKMLLDRLPAQPAFHVEEPQEPIKPTTYEEITSTMRVLVKAGIVPLQLFEMFVKKPEGAVEH